MNNDSTTTPTPPDTYLDLPAEMFRSGDTPEDAFIEIENPSLGNTLYERVKFTDIDGWAIYEGDIILGRADKFRSDSEPRGLVINGDTYRWPNGKMAYEIGDETVRTRVEAAIEHWETKTPITFHVRTEDDADYVIFKGQGGCSSNIGRQGGEQVITLGSGCSAGSAIHEIGHALGLFHEQCRGDRDNFIQLVEANIDPNFMHNFFKHETDASKVGTYDFGSIMHYPETAFSVNGEPTILTKSGQSIGQRDGLSSGDIEAIRTIYSGLDWSKFETVEDSGKGGDEPPAGTADNA